MPEAIPSRIALLGVPIEIGASQLGTLMGPDALRTAGIGRILDQLGFFVEDHGNIAKPVAALASLFTGMKWGEGVFQQWKLIHQAVEDGFFTQPDRHLPGLSKVGENIGYLNGGHMFNLNALRCQSLSEGVILGRRLAAEYLAFYRKYVPGCAKRPWASSGGRPAATVNSPSRSPWLLAWTERIALP